MGITGYFFPLSCIINFKYSLNIEAYLNNLGFPAEMAKEFSERQWCVTYSSKDGKLVNHVKITNRPALPERTYVYTLGEELELEGVDGDKSLAIVTWDGSKFTEVHRSCPGAPVEWGPCNMSRELKGDEMIITSTMKGVTLTEVYVRC